MTDQAVCSHEWQPVSLRLTTVGAERELQCVGCGASSYDAGQAALGDRRPGLDFTVDDLPEELRE